jgi:DNA-binding LytR/AlgR family response regulator
MRVIIIEDEKLSADHLISLLRKIDQDVEIVAYFDSVKDSVTAFNGGLEADLIFLDIHLADGNSFEIFTKTTIEAPIIFTTAFDQYAIKAFKHNSIDYLLKPISLTDLQFSFEKFINYKQIVKKNLLENIAQAYHQINNQYKNRFLVKIGSSIDTIKTEDIHHFETQDSLSFLINTKGNRYPIDYTLDQLKTLLNPKDFFRINRKIILSINAIEKVSSYFNGRLSISNQHLEGDARIVSRERVQDFKLWLNS